MLTKANPAQMLFENAAFSLTIARRCTSRQTEIKTAHKLIEGELWKSTTRLFLSQFTRHDKEPVEEFQILQILDDLSELRGRGMEVEEVWEGGGAGSKAGNLLVRLGHKSGGAHRLSVLSPVTLLKS